MYNKSTDTDGGEVMERIFFAFLESVEASVFLIPVFMIYNRAFFHSKTKTLIYLVFSMYLTGVLALVGFPGILSLTLDFNFNIIPFVNAVADYRNAFLNVILFMPFGVFLPILFKEFRVCKRTILTGVLSSLMVETTQLFTFRATDINDLITNTIGMMIGYYIGKLITKNFAIHTMQNTRASDFALLCVTVVTTMFLFQPLISRIALIFVNRYVL